MKNAERKTLGFSSWRLQVKYRYANEQSSATKQIQHCKQRINIFKKKTFFSRRKCDPCTYLAFFISVMFSLRKAKLNLPQHISFSVRVCVQENHFPFSKKNHNFLKIRAFIFIFNIRVDFFLNMKNNFSRCKYTNSRSLLVEHNEIEKAYCKFVNIFENA